MVSLNSEKPVCFKSRGKNLFGILHRAENNSRDVGVILLNAGLQYRVGPHRIYVKIARRLSKLGFFVLRIDFPGIGDSEGEIRDVHFDLFDTEDTINAIDLFSKEEKIKKVVLLGICAGARNAIMAAIKDSRVDAIISLSLPVVTDLQKFSEASLPGSGAMSTVVAKDRFKIWIRKSLNANNWKRFIFSESENNLFSVVKVLFVLVSGNKNKEYRKNEVFFKAFETYLSSKRKALFIYGEKDTVLMKEFEVKLKYLIDKEKQVYEYYVVPNGAHTFTTVDAETDVMEKTVNWLVHQYEA